MTRILALETTTIFGTVAVWEDAKAVREIAPQTRSARSLVPAVKELLETVGWKIGEIDCLAVSVGPGSFTGLRVGIATAKTLAYALGIPVVGVDTLAVIATAALQSSHFAQNSRDGFDYCCEQTISVAVDAQREEIVAQNFRVTPECPLGIPTPDGEQRIIPDQAWWDFGACRSHDALFTGPVLKRLAAKTPPEVRLAEESLWFPSASAVARSALHRIASGDYDDFWTLLPKYFRPSAAEEKATKATP